MLPGCLCNFCYTELCWYCDWSLCSSTNTLINEKRNDEEIVAVHATKAYSSTGSDKRNVTHSSHGMFYTREKGHPVSIEYEVRDVPEPFWT